MSNLISCLMPTYNRRAFVPQAVDYFLRQDYPSRELIVVDDGTDPVEDLIPADERLRYVRLARRHTIGAKRNIACEEARGEFIAHWDDDDWMAGSRLSQQIEALWTSEADVVGLDQLLFWDITSDRAFRYSHPSYEPAWVHDPTFCYRRTMWLRDPFPNANFGLDSAYLSAGTPKRVVPISDATFYVGIIHGGNTSPKRTSTSRWRSCPTEEVELRLGDDRTFYERVRS